MKDLRLDPVTNDLEISNFSFGLTTDFIDSLMQRLRIKFKFFLGEWYLNITKGVPYFDKILVKNPDLAEIAAIYKVLILSDEDVKELTEFTVDFDQALRKYKLDFKILSTNGDEIEFSEVV